MTHDIPYLSGNPGLESLAATLNVIARRTDPADEPSAALDGAMRRGWIGADGRPTPAARAVLRELIATEAEHPEQTHPKPADPATGRA